MLMVGGYMQQQREVIASPLVPNAPPCTYIPLPGMPVHTNGGWCKFPEGCPAPQPTNWPPWPFVEPAAWVPQEVPPSPSPPAPPLPPVPMAQQSCAVNFNKPCKLPKWNHTWNLTRSTSMSPCNFTGTFIHML